MAETRNQAWARRYVWRCLWETLRNDLDNGSAWIFDDDDHDEADRRRVRKAVNQVLKVLDGKATAPGGERKGGNRG